MAIPKYGQFIILDRGNMGESSLVTDTVDVSDTQTFKIIAYWFNGSGSPVGVLSLESSDTGITYETVLESEQSIADDTGFHIWDYPYNPTRMIRARYTKTQGLGTMTIFIQMGG